MVRRAIDRLPSKNANDTTLQSFAGSMAQRWGVMIVGLIAVMQQLGVQTTSILAVLGAASLAIGLALQGALSNVAAGVMILILRPYRVGDVVEINGRTGTVKSLDLFGTFLSDADNLDIFVPNSKVFGEVIINYSTPGSRRMELNFRVDYADDLDQALGVLLACAKRPISASWPSRLPDAKVVLALADSAVIVTLHAWAAGVGLLGCPLRHDQAGEGSAGRGGAVDPVSAPGGCGEGGETGGCSKGSGLKAARPKPGTSAKGYRRRSRKRRRRSLEGGTACGLEIHLLRQAQHEVDFCRPILRPHPEPVEGRGPGLTRRGDLNLCRFLSRHLSFFFRVSSRFSSGGGLSGRESRQRLLGRWL